MYVSRRDGDRASMEPYMQRDRERYIYIHVCVCPCADASSHWFISVILHFGI